AAGLGVATRAFQLKRANPMVAPLPAYSGSAPSLRFDVGAHPAAWLGVRNSIARSFGVALAYEVGPKIESQVQGGSTTYGVSFSAWEAGLFYRLALGDWPVVVRPGVRLGNRSFSVDGTAPPVPTVEYDYKSVG